MSHQATNWAMKQRGMKPAAKLVLISLADRHNPENGCFPSHKRIATDANMSERSVRTHLAELEAMGLLRRVKGTGGRLKRAATRYVFAFEEGFENIEQPAQRAESRRQKCAESRRQNLPPNPVREPLKEEDAREARDPDDLFEGVKRVLGFGPKAILPSWWRNKAAREHVAGWKRRYQLSDAEILEVAAMTRKDHPTPPDGPKALDRAMERRWRAAQAQKSRQRRQPHSPRPSGAQAPSVTAEGNRASRADQVAYWAARVKSGSFIPPSAISSGLARDMIASGAVAATELRKAGISA